MDELCSTEKSIYSVMSANKSTRPFVYLAICLEMCQFPWQVEWHI